MAGQALLRAWQATASPRAGPPARRRHQPRLTCSTAVPVPEFMAAPLVLLVRPSTGKGRAVPWSVPPCSHCAQRPQKPHIWPSQA